MNYQIITPATFVESYSGALQDYLEMQYQESGHLLDLLAAAGEFFSVSYHSISATIEMFDYTEPATTQHVKMEQETSNESAE